MKQSIVRVFFKYKYANVKWQKQNNFENHSIDPLNFEHANVKLQKQNNFQEHGADALNLKQTFCE
jgi:hypothetical protein